MVDVVNNASPIRPTRPDAAPQAEPLPFLLLRHATAVLRDIATYRATGWPLDAARLHPKDRVRAAQRLSLGERRAEAIRSWAKSRVLVGARPVALPESVAAGAALAAPFGTLPVSAYAKVTADRVGDLCWAALCMEGYLEVAGKAANLSPARSPRPARRGSTK